MKRNLYLSLALLCAAFAGYGQGSQINGTTQVHPGGHYGAYGTLTFSAGYLVTPRNDPNSNVYFTTGSASAGQSDASHVNGYAEKQGTTAFTFPIGDGTTLRPAGISAPSGSTNFQAAYFKGNPGSATLPTGAPFATANLGTGVGAVSTVEYWDINGSSATNITLTWNAASNLNTLTGGDATKLTVVGYNPATSKWEDLGKAGGTTGTVSTTGTVTANAVTPNTFSAFTFGTSAAAVAPDLSPGVDIDGLSFTTSSLSKDFIINIYNGDSNNPNAFGPTSAPIVFAINKLSAFTITYPTTSGSSNVSGGTANNNGDWSFDETTRPGFITVTSKAGTKINGGGRAILGFTITRNAGVAGNTTQNITANVQGGTGGGETPTNNNRVVTSVTAQ